MNWRSDRGDQSKLKRHPWDHLCPYTGQYTPSNRFYCYRSVSVHLRSRSSSLWPRTVSTGGLWGTCWNFCLRVEMVGESSGRQLSHLRDLKLFLLSDSREIFTLPLSLMSVLKSGCSNSFSRSAIFTPRPLKTLKTAIICILLR